MYSEIIQLPFYVFLIGQIMIAIGMILTGWRIWVGPTIADRVISLDLLASLLMVELVLMIFAHSFISYLDVITAIAIISFIATVAFARYLENKDAPL